MLTRPSKGYPLPRGDIKGDPLKNERVISIQNYKLLTRRNSDNMLPVNGKVLDVRLERCVAKMYVYECKTCATRIKVFPDYFEYRLEPPKFCPEIEGGCGQKTIFEPKHKLSEFDSKHIIRVSGDRKTYIILMDELPEPPIRGDKVTIDITYVIAKKNTKSTFHAIGSKIELV